MQIRKYRACSLQEALQSVRRELGSEAMIVSTRTIGSGRGAKQEVEVIAAIDYDLGTSKRRAASSFSLCKSRGSVWKEVLSDQLLLEQIRQDLGELKKRVESSHTFSLEEKKSEMSMELKELKKMTQFIFQQLVALQGPSLNHHLAPFCIRMLTQGIGEELVEHVLREITRTLPPEALERNEEVRSGIISTIEKEIPLAGPIQLSSEGPKIVALVGPTGVGKTTTLAKLAAHFSVVRKKKVALVTIDTYRIAAIEQLKIYATIMDLPFRAVSSAEEFTRTLAQFADRELILVDTAGRNQRNQCYLEELARYLRNPFPIETHLVISITHKDEILSAIGDHFSILPLDCVIFTKLDECTTYGTMLNQLFKMKIPLSYLTTGQKVPEDIEVATKARIISLALGEAKVSFS